MPIKTESIRLDQFLKLARLVASGGEAKGLIQQGLVKVNEGVEFRRGCRLRVGDRVEIAAVGVLHVTAEGKDSVAPEY